MTVDAGRAAFEELKRLSAPLVEFVAVNQGIPHEIVFKVLLGLGNAVRLSAGQAAAAVLLNKPAEQVTEAEALKAIRGIAVEGEGEGDRVWRAQRAAQREMVFTLAAEAHLRHKPDAGFDAFRKDYLAIERAKATRQGRRG